MLELLHHHSVGRFAVVMDDQHPLVVPVNYVMTDGCICFRTGEGTKLRALRDRPVSFQPDQIDPLAHTGWSVGHRPNREVADTKEARHEQASSNRAGGMSRAPLHPGMEELTGGECVELLASHRFGRVAFAADGMPIVLPVNYLYDEPCVVIRSAPGTKLADMPQTMVAFEIDESEPSGAWGWSVLVQGPAFDITDSIDRYSAELRNLPVVTDPPGARDHWLKIGASTVTGRWFGRHPLDRTASVAAGGPSHA